MTHWMLHRISSTASAASRSPSSSLSLSVSLFSPALPLLLSPPSLLSLFSPFSFPTGRHADLLGLTAEEDVHTTRNSSSSSRRTGKCAEACFPPSCSTGKTSRSPLISAKDYLFEKCVCVLVRAGIWKVGREDYHTLGAFTTTAGATQGECYSGYFHSDMLFNLYLFLCACPQIYIQCFSAGAVGYFPPLCSSGICCSVDWALCVCTCVFATEFVECLTKVTPLGMLCACISPCSPFHLLFTPLLLPAGWFPRMPSSRPLR